MDKELIDMIATQMELGEIGILILALRHSDPEAHQVLEHAIAHRFRLMN